MEGTVGAPPQRVCPKCARISWATGPRCPYCRSRFRRQVTGTFAWLLLAAVILTLAGMAAMLLIARHEFNQELNDRTAEIQQHFDSQLTQLRNDVRSELSALPATAPFPTPTATPSPTPGATASPTPSPTATATATPLAP